MGWGEATWLFLVAVARRYRFLILGVGFTALGVFERITHREVSVPPWVTWALLGLGFLVACIGAYRDLANKGAAVSEQLGHRMREDFRAGVRRREEDDALELVLQKYGFDEYAAVECVVVAGTDRWTSGDRPDPGNASGFGNAALELAFPADFEGPAPEPAGRTYAASFIAKRRVGSLQIEDTEVAQVGFEL